MALQGEGLSPYRRQGKAEEEVRKGMISKPTLGLTGLAGINASLIGLPVYHFHFVFNPRQWVVYCAYRTGKGGPKVVTVFPRRNSSF